MGYRIDYGPVKKVKPNTFRDGFRLTVLTGLFFLFFVLGVQKYWPEGYIALQDLFSLEHLTSVETAIGNLMDQLETGSGLKEALVVFCEEIMANAPIPQ